jgi:hypothetical protein
MVPANASMGLLEIQKLADVVNEIHFGIGEQTTVFVGHLLFTTL